MEKESKIWDAVAEGNNCVSITIGDSIDIEEGKMTLKGKFREPLLSMDIESRDFKVCIPVGDPVFVELHTKGGLLVKYVKGSGEEHYKDYKEYKDLINNAGKN